jgi:hypothetical protein
MEIFVLKAWSDVVAGLWPVQGVHSKKSENFILEMEFELSFLILI